MRILGGSRRKEGCGKADASADADAIARRKVHFTSYLAIHGVERRQGEFRCIVLPRLRRNHSAAPRRLDITPAPFMGLSNDSQRLTAI